jgi:hypothetical protein
MSEKANLEEILLEVEELYRLHGDGMVNADGCREFGARMSNVLSRLEEMRRDRIADRVMDLLSSCSPKLTSHCETAQRTKGTLERIRDSIRQEISETDK